MGIFYKETYDIQRTDEQQHLQENDRKFFYYSKSLRASGYGKDNICCISLSKKVVAFPPAVAIYSLLAASSLLDITIQYLFCDDL